MSALSNSTAWKDALDASPPEAWQDKFDDERFWFSADLSSLKVTHKSTGFPAVLDVAWEITTDSADGDLLFKYISLTGEKSVNIGAAVGSGVINLTDADDDAFEFWVTDDDAQDTAPVSGVVAIGDPGVNFNCECEDDFGARTLTSLRASMARRLGYAAQAANLPTGMSALLDEFLQDAQTQLYMRYNSLRTERIYRWNMVKGQRYYDIDENNDSCAKEVDAYKLSWVGIEDSNGTWLPLHEGIPPTFYTSVQNYGLPQRYEIRQCIEVFPAPDDEYVLRIKGHFGLGAFASANDKTTIDSQLVFLTALANAKAHYGQRDASNIFSQAEIYLGGLVSGSHGTARYVPRTEPRAPMTKPVMTEFIE